MEFIGQYDILFEMMAVAVVAAGLIAWSEGKSTREDETAVSSCSTTDE